MTREVSKFVNRAYIAGLGRGFMCVFEIDLV